MQQLVLGREEFRDKVYACWLGKNIGGTLGEPWECKPHTHALTFYEPLPDKAAPNDDLDLQLVWLKMLEDRGVDPSVRTFADYWARYAAAYPWNEYGFFMRNYARGLKPPIAGCFENYFVDEMGSPIRSEIWACLHPGDPDAAARMAWKDSALDHAGGEGMWGEMFWAAVEAAAFVERDPITLIRIGLNMIPLSSHVGRSVREALWCHQHGLTWGEARERIATRFGHIQPCNAVPNHGFTVIGWLYGRDFGDQLCKAVNCGLDTDCTGATLGALLGILHGSSEIPDVWREPIGEQIVLHKFTGPCDPPADLYELTDRTVALAEAAAVRREGFAFGDATSLPDEVLRRLHVNRRGLRAAAQDSHMGVDASDDLQIALHYRGEPVLRPGIAKDIDVSVVPIDAEAIDRAASLEPKVELDVPQNWECSRLGPRSFRLQGRDIGGRNDLRIRAAGQEMTFTILGPDEATGFQAGANVETCPNCRARAEACICS